MSFQIVSAVFRKECLDTLRDKRTLVAMIVVPIFLYPILLILTTQALMLQESRLEAEDSRVAVRGQGSDAITEWLEGMEGIELTEAEAPEQALLEGRVDAIVVAEGDVREILGQGGSAGVTIEYDASAPRSQQAASRVFAGLEEQGESLLAARLEAQGLDESFARPLAVERNNIAPPERTTGALLGTILPVIMVVMLCVGAFYPAIDLTAGEKERGTFETLLSTPISKLDIVAGKFLTVFCLCLLTGLLNLASMTASIASQFAYVGEQLTPFAIRLEPHMLVMALVVLVPLAFFISAAMMSIAVFARSFKEAQNFVTPFFLAVMLPALLASIPGVELTPVNRFIPIANVALLFKEMLTGGVSFEAFFAVMISTAVFALLALQLAAWLFQQEALLLSEERGMPLALRRSRLTPRPAPTAGFALFLYALLLLMLFYPATYLQQRAMYSGVLWTQWGLLLAPTVLLLWYARVRLKDALSLRLPTFGAAFGTLLMGLGWVIINVQWSIWQEQFLPVPDALKEQLEALLQGGTERLNLAALLFILAVSPAICEEVVFRGAIFSGLRQRLPAWAAIAAVGVMFGMFHLSVHRVIITGMSGILLTYLVWRGGSIYLAMGVHLLINSAGVLAETGHMPGFVQDYLNAPDLAERGLPIWLLLGSGVVFIGGLVLFERTAGLRPSPRDGAESDSPGR